VSPSEISFLACGLVFGAAVGAALVQVVRARPPIRHEVRLTITPNAIPARRAHTLSVPHGVPHPGLIPGSPEADALQGDPEPVAAIATPGPAGPAQARTRVPSAAVLLPAAAVGIPVGMAHLATARGSLAVTPAPRPSLEPAPQTGERASQAAAPALMATARPPQATARTPHPGAHAPQATARTPQARAGTAVAVLGAATAVLEAPAPGREDVFTTLVRPRAPVEELRPVLAGDVVAVTARAAAPGRSAVARPELEPPSGPTLTRPRASSGSSGSPDPTLATGSPATAADPCSGVRRAVEERCALADVAREQARRAADALHEARRTYDVLRERVDRAQAQADPRQVAAAKDRLHAAFRAASDRTAGPDQTEAAARAWLNEINQLNNAVREARRIIDAGEAELRTQLTALERLSAEADAARIAGENAEVGCREAREELAGCEEAQERARRALPPVDEEPHPFAGVWPLDRPDLPEPDQASPAELMAGLPAIVRVLRGDREARERLVATLAAGEQEAEREWQLRVARLVDATVGRAIEDGYLDLPDDHPFWRLFSSAERRDVVSALSALGFRYDGLGGFADGRTPATRDLSLAVGYAGVDRMRIRTWPRDSEIALLYERAVVASDEWLADQAGDLSLGRMVDALGSRAADIADVWNAWGRVRPALLAT
jgi:hypothetical protein